MVSVTAGGGTHTTLWSGRQTREAAARRAVEGHQFRARDIRPARRGRQGAGGHERLAAQRHLGEPECGGRPGLPVGGAGAAHTWGPPGQRPEPSRGLTCQTRVPGGEDAAGKTPHDPLTTEATKWQPPCKINKTKTTPGCHGNVSKNKGRENLQGLQGKKIPRKGRSQREVRAALVTSHQGLCEQKVMELSPKDRLEFHIWRHRPSKIKAKGKYFQVNES